MPIMDITTGNPEGKPAPLPWHRQPSDTSASFHAFMHYRDLPPWNRSIDAAYLEHQEKCLKSVQNGGQKRVERGAKNQTSRAPSRWQTWSSENRWVARAEAYDNHQAEIRRQRRQRELEEALDDQAVLSNALLQRAANRIRNLNPQSIPVAVLPALLRTASQMQLRALGHEEKLAISGPDGGPIQHEASVVIDAIRDPATRQALDLLVQCLESEPGGDSEEVV